MSKVLAVQSFDCCDGKIVRTAAGWAHKPSCTRHDVKDWCKACDAEITLTEEYDGDQSRDLGAILMAVQCSAIERMAMILRDARDENADLAETLGR